MATTLTPSQALRRPRQLDVRLLAGALLAGVVFVGTVATYNGLSASRDVLEAAGDLPAGTVLSPDDLRVVSARLDDQTYRAAIPANERDAVVGEPLVAPAYADQILVRSQFAARGSLATGQEAFVIALPADTAAGGRFHPGDDVQVLWVKGKGGPDTQASVLLERVRVLDVSYQSNSAIAGSGRPASPAGATTLTLAVTSEQAVQLAEAKVVGQLDAALLPPSPGGSPHA